MQKTFIMELLYIWIDSYKNIKQQGFNFSLKYQFEFTPKIESNEVIGGNLTCDENKDFPDNFFDEEISNVTAIVGENGSGKSSVSEFLFNLSEAKDFFLIVFKTIEGLLHYSTYSYADINFPKNIKRAGLTDFFGNIDTIYYSDIFNENKIDTNHTNDISLNASYIGIKNKI